jgi:multidrug efflux pump subunit AcrA (membrane-fusion protein)
MAIEPGGLVAQIVDFRQPLVRLDLPPDIVAAGPPPQVELFATSAARSGLGGVLNRPMPASARQGIEATYAGPAPRVDPASQLVGCWYEAQLPAKDQAARALWRPGLQVTAEVRAEGAAPQAAVAVPARAVLYHEGRPLVYVRIDREKYQRREVRLLGREGNSWVVAARQGDLPVGVARGEAVVARHAQVLLSKEFLSAAADND